MCERDFLVLIPLASAEYFPARVRIQRVAAQGRITQDDHDRKARELNECRTEIALWIEPHQQGEGDYRTTLESLIFVSSRAAEIFERSKTEQRRELIALSFQICGSREER